MYQEIVLTDPESAKAAQPKKQNHRTFAFMSRRNQLSNEKCVTVVKNRVLRGDQRLQALLKSAEETLEQSEKTTSVQSFNKTLEGYNFFKVFTKKSQYSWNNSMSITGEPAEKYLELFSAIVAGKEEVVRQLCKPDEKGHCVLLTCIGYGEMDPLTLALTTGNRSMITCIIDLLLMQYTPIMQVREVKGTKVSNYALVTGDYEETEAFIDPNSDASTIINTCDPQVLFSSNIEFDATKLPRFSALIRGNPYFGQSSLEEDKKSNVVKCSALEYLVYRGDVELASFFLSEVQRLSEGVFSKDLKANGVKEEDRSKKLLLNILFRGDESDYQSQ